MPIKINDLMDLMDKHPEEFEDLANIVWFRGWLFNNYHIYEEFESESLHQFTVNKRENFSGRYIVNKIRWDSNLQSNSDRYKISDHVAPYLCRLTMLANPMLANFFKKNINRAKVDTSYDLLEIMDAINQGTP